MGRLSIAAFLIASLVAVIAAASGAFGHMDRARDPAVGQAPDRVLGTRDGAYELFTPGEVVSAGGGGNGGAGLSDDDPVALGNAAPGTGSTASRHDHVHPSTGLATSADLKTIETQISNIRQVPIPGSSSNGDVLTRDSTIQGADWGWKPPAKQPLSSFGTVGTEGQCAKANATRDGLTYGNCASGGGSGPSLSNNTPEPLGTAAAGKGTAASRDDHVHLLPDGIAQNRAVSNQNKNDITSLKSVRNPALSSATAGQFVRQNKAHSAYETVAPDAAVLSGLPAITGKGGNVLKVNSAATGLEWGAGGSGGGSGGGAVIQSVVTVQAPGDAVYGHGSSGTGRVTLALPDTLTLQILREQVPVITCGRSSTLGPLSVSTSNEFVVQYNNKVTTAALASLVVINSSGIRIDINGGTVGTSASGVVCYFPILAGGGGGGGGNGGGGATAFTGLTDTPASYSGNQGKIVAVNDNENALTFVDKPAGTALSDTAPVRDGTASAGTSTAASRGDHVHPANLSDTAPLPAGPAAQAGTGTSAARHDHVHKATPGNLPATTGHAGNCLKVNSGETGIEWAGCGGGGGGGGGDVDLQWDTFPRMKVTVAANARIGRLTLTEDQDRNCHGADFVAVYDGSNTYQELGALHVFSLGGFRGTLFYGNNTRFDLIRLICQDPDGDTRGSIVVQASTTPSSPQDVFFALGELTGGGGGGDTPTIPKPTAGDASKFLRVNAGGSAYELADVTQGHPFGTGSDTTAIKTGSAALGTTGRVARADHAHNLPTSLYGTPVAVGTANAAGTATTLARSDHVHSTGNSVATRGQLDDVQDQVTALNGLTADLILGTPGALSWADVNSDGSQGGIARGATSGESLNGAVALTYASPSQTGNSTFMIVRIPSDADPRSYRTVDASEITLRYSLSIERLIGTKGSWSYYEFPTRLASTETLTLQISGHPVGRTTFDGKLGPNAAGSLQDHDALLYTATNSATQWGTGNVIVAAGVAARIYDAMRTRTTDRFNRLELEVAYAHTVNGAKRISKALIPIPLQRRGGIDNNSTTVLAGVGRLGSATINAHINLPVANDAGTSDTHMSIGGCGFCQGGEMLEIHLYGVH